MPKNSLKSDWYAEKEIVLGVLIKDKAKRFGWSINFDELSQITNGHSEFLSKVKEFADKTLDSVDNAQIYRTIDVSRNGEKIERIEIVFDVCDIYIKLFSCNIDHEKQPYVIDASYNKSFVWSMSTML